MEDNIKRLVSESTRLNREAGVEVRLCLRDGQTWHLVALLVSCLEGVGRNGKVKITACVMSLRSM
eukprot:354173-Chlamydomonas_euryale.AAC.3